MARGTFCSETTKMLLVGSRKYPRAGLFSWRSLKWAMILRNFPPRPRVIRIPRLVDLGMVRPEDPYEGEDPDAISDHGKGVPLGHALLAVQEVA